MIYSQFASYRDDLGISPFSDSPAPTHPLLKRFKTREAKRIAQKIFSHLKKNFVYTNTMHLLPFFDTTLSEQRTEEIHSFFESLFSLDIDFTISSCTKDTTPFRLPYSYTAVTADEETYAILKKRNIPVHLLISEWDLQSLQDYDVIEAIDCDQFESALDQLEQVQFVADSDSIYPEQHLSKLAEFKTIISHLVRDHDSFRHPFFPKSTYDTIDELNELLALLDTKQEKNSFVDIQSSLLVVNKEIEKRLKEMTLEGESLFEALSGDRLPEKVVDTIKTVLREQEIPESLVHLKIPVECDDEAYDEHVKENERDWHLHFKKTLQTSKSVHALDDRLYELETLLLILDLVQGLKSFISEEQRSFVQYTDRLSMTHSKNMFLIDPQPIDYLLDGTHSCAVLTGANSGGKTTLLEHIIQVLVLGYLGIPLSGTVEMPHLEEIYYFSKQKGSTSKGAFETLLTQFSSIQGSKQTLILADEIEAVTEPGIAARIILSIVEYFQKQDTYVVIATHLGQDLVDHLPKSVRIDGIQAKGLDENNQLIVDHNPIQGTLARSTPELIIRRLANHSGNEFITYLSKSLDSS